MGRLFGTDGVRGVANVELTVDLAMKLGKAGAYQSLQLQEYKERLFLDEYRRRFDEPSDGVRHLSRFAYLYEIRDV